MHISTALALAAAMASAAVACGRRWVWNLGPYGPVLAPPLLLILWFAFLGLGQYCGSLAVSGWLAALPLFLIAGCSVARYRRARRSPFRWTFLDKCIFAFLSFFIIAYCGNDSFCHYSVVGAYLRNNIPPTAQNDPSRPLRYHGIFDAAAALVTDASGVTPETALDLVSILCVFACLSCLQGLSRILFQGRCARQCCRLFYALGFGPIYLNHAGTLISRLAGGEGGPPGSFLFHGHATQSFVESIPRRPMGLNHVLFLFVLTVSLPRLPSARGGRIGTSRSLHPAWWLPCAFLLPQASEDLTGLCALVVLWLWVSGALAFRWAAAWAAMTLAALPMSGVLSSMVSPLTATAVPRLALGWPPHLPYWVDLETPMGLSRDMGLAVIRRGVPLVSFDSAWVMLTEWGPLFFGGLLLGLRDARRRVVVALFGVGFLLASCLELRGWYKADLDRFLFYGTSAAFSLAAAWVEVLENARTRAALSRARFPFAVLVFVVLPTTLGPVAFATRYSVYWVLGRNSRYPVVFSDGELFRLRRVLAPVGPRDRILTDARFAQKLVLAGFVVDAPLAPGFSVGLVDEAKLRAYVTNKKLSRPAWYFLPTGDPRVNGRRAFVVYDGYILTRGGEGGTRLPGKIIRAE